MTTNTTSNIKDIVINGVSINALKAQQEAAWFGTGQFMDEALLEGTRLVHELATSLQDESLVAQAAEIFEAMKLVSSVVGFVADMHYYEDGLSRLLEIAAEGEETSEVFSDLLSTLKHLEYESFLMNEGEE